LAFSLRLELLAASVMEFALHRRFFHMDSLMTAATPRQLLMPIRKDHSCCERCEPYCAPVKSVDELQLIPTAV
jgi:hypothetical protein